MSTPVQRLARALLDCRDDRCSLCVRCLTAVRDELGLKLAGFEGEDIQPAVHAGRKTDRLAQESASRRRHREHLAELDAELRAVDPAYDGWIAKQTPRAPKGNHKAKRMARP